MATFRLMLATDAPDLEALAYPVLASPKLDGVRAYVDQTGTLVTRSLKPVPNPTLQALYGRPQLVGLDGELILGPATDQDVFRKTTSEVMSKTPERPEQVSFFVFDDVNVAQAPFCSRLKTAHRRVAALNGRIYATRSLSGRAYATRPRPALVPVHHQPVASPTHLRQYLERCLSDGYEGVIVRDPQGIYKFGRSTLREGLMLKLKKWRDAEAVVIGLDEQEANENAPTINAQGLTERSSHKAGKRKKGTLGALIVNSPEFGQLKIGTGFTQADRQQIWDNAGQYVGKTVRFRFFDYGIKTAPRFPVFAGWRDARDM